MRLWVCKGAVPIVGNGEPRELGFYRGALSNWFTGGRAPSRKQLCVFLFPLHPGMTSIVCVCGGGGIDKVRGEEGRQGGNFGVLE